MSARKNYLKLWENLPHIFSWLIYFPDFIRELVCDRIWESWLLCTQQQDTHFTIKQWQYTLTNSSGKLLLLWLVAETCQKTMTVWVSLSGFIYPWQSESQLNSPHDWLMSLVMDLAVLCDMWRWKWHQRMSFGCFQCWHSLCQPFHGFSPTRVLSLYRCANWWYWLH